jgi:flagellum-specific ATP synthase
MPAISTPQHVEKARSVRQLLSAYAASEDLIRVGAYQKGADPLLDRAIVALPQINNFLQQRKEDAAPFELTLQSLQALPS